MLKELNIIFSSFVPLLSFIIGKKNCNNFCPGLRVCTFYGTKRSLEAFHQQYDILLTSYGILRNEREMHCSKVPFEVAIFDEIQIAKNQFSRVYAALIKIKSSNESWG